MIFLRIIDECGELCTKILFERDTHVICTTTASEITIDSLTSTWRFMRKSRILEPLLLALKAILQRVT